MPEETPLDAASLVASAETAAGFWQMGILWTPLISGESTRGTYSLMEQLMPAKAGPPPHVHDHGEEVFYILDGEMAVPAALDLQVAMLGTPATSPVVLSPRGAQRPPTGEQEHMFAQRLHDLATQTMSSQRDLLGNYRDQAAAHPNMP